MPVFPYRPRPKEPRLSQGAAGTDKAEARQRPFSTQSRSSSQQGSGPGADDGDGAGDIQALREELERERERRVEAERRLARTQGKPQPLIDDDKYTVDDATIINMVFALRRDIKEWSCNFFMSPIRRKPNGTPVALQEWSTWLEEIMPLEGDRLLKLLQLDHEEMRTLYQAALWFQLANQVCCYYLWAGGPCVRAEGKGKSCPAHSLVADHELDFRMFYKSLQQKDSHDGPTISMYMQWRAQTSRILIPLIHDQCVQSTIASTCTQIQKFFEKSTMHIGFEPWTWSRKGVANSEGRVSLEDVVNSVVNLERVKYQQRIHWYLSGPTFDAFEPYHMEIHKGKRSVEYEDPKRQSVMLCIALGVIKYDWGYSKGTAKWTAPIKAIVELGETPAPPKSGGGAGDLN